MVKESRGTVPHGLATASKGPFPAQLSRQRTPVCYDRFTSIRTVQSLPSNVRNGSKRVAYGGIAAVRRRHLNGSDAHKWSFSWRTIFRLKSNQSVPAYRDLRQPECANRNGRPKLRRHLPSQEFAESRRSYDATFRNQSSGRRHGKRFAPVIWWAPNSLIDGSVRLLGRDGAFFRQLS
jgi:hypothetical protein